MDYFPLLLATIAGLSTVIGALIAICIKKAKFCYLCVAFGFSAGVMIFVSFTELLFQGIQSTNLVTSFLSFFGGVLIIYIIDILIPHAYEEEAYSRKGKVNRTAMFLVLGIAIHNFPEGIAVLFSSMANARLGILIAIAIALHNIPEGIAVSMPIIYATKNRKKAFYYSALSGAAEPLGALISMIFLGQFIDQFVLGVILSAVAGIMVFISFDELLPYVYKQKNVDQHLPMLGMFIGMFVMAASMLLL
ncbi:MAG: zinc transporter ZupT [Candidatus Aenigmarchaeota archaeon]|nr:zinc transporter ZupT [Candidatus Aenigmarchaeota archaeon]